MRRRLEADNIAHSRGQSSRTAGIAAQRKSHAAGGNHYARPRAGTTRNKIRIERADRVRIAANAYHSGGEFIHGVFANQHGAQIQ